MTLHRLPWQYGEQLRHAKLESVKEKFGFEQPVLDVGCGFGEFSGVFFDSMIEVGIDISHDDLLMAAQDKIYKNLYVRDARDMQFEDESFATAISISVLEHISEVEKVIAEVYRVLKSGGLFVFTLPTDDLYQCLLYPTILEKLGLKRVARNYFRIYNIAFKHLNIWPHSKWEQIVEDVGFELLYSKKIISKKVTQIFDFALLTAFPSQVGRLLIGNRLIWAPRAKKRLLRRFFGHMIDEEHSDGSNIIIVARKPAGQS